MLFYKRVAVDWVSVQPSERVLSATGSLVNAAREKWKVEQQNAGSNSVAKIPGLDQTHFPFPAKESPT